MRQAGLSLIHWNSIFESGLRVMGSRASVTWCDSVTVMEVLLYATQTLAVDELKVEKNRREKD